MPMQQMFTQSYHNTKRASERRSVEDVREFVRQEVPEETTEAIRISYTQTLTDNIRRSEANIRAQFEQVQAIKVESFKALHRVVDDLWEKYDANIDPLIADFTKCNFAPTLSTSFAASSCFCGYRNSPDFNLNDPRTQNRWFCFFEASSGESATDADHDTIAPSNNQGSH